mmetsp:Transcript_3067/g.8424  ORF Transcript_3067/g.8424 Transcript_3067/m.8424 type:complete len:88 (+) Transcript_3067:111-374(+)
MARTRTVLPLLLLAAFAFCATCFIAPRGVNSALRGSEVAGVSQPLEAAMQARGGENVVEDPGTYIIGITALMIASVVANSGGFFGPW